MKRKMDHISCFKERPRFSVLDKVNCTVARNSGLLYVFFILYLNDDIIFITAVK